MEAQWVSCLLACSARTFLVHLRLNLGLTSRKRPNESAVVTKQSCGDFRCRVNSPEKLLGIFPKPQDTAVKISPSIHPAWLVLVVMNEKGNLSILLSCPCECCTLHAASYLNLCCLVHYCSIESKAGCLSVTTAHKGQLSFWRLSANSCRT